MRVRIKICGIARPEDARSAAELGVDFLGVVLARSPRGIIPEKASTWVQQLRKEFPKPEWVGVFVRPSAAEVTAAVERLSLDYVQIHGMPAEWVPEDLPRPWIRVLSPASVRQSFVEESHAYATLIDTPRADGYGGTGKVFDWSGIGPIPARRRVFLAGGLDAANVASAITRVRPWAVDASSRLERAPGEKDPARVRAFVEAVRGTEIPEEEERA
jgi:phosphoribosylanthranilate isomerase